MDGNETRLRRWMARVLKEAQEAERSARFVWARQHRPKRAATENTETRERTSR